MPDPDQVRRVRTLFISDVHLGMRSARTADLIGFLKEVDAETIYLIGDIVDGWRLKQSWYWPAEYNHLVQSILDRARNGTRIVYVPGNHDEFLRDYVAMHFGDVEVIDRAVHVGVDGKTYLVIHGDQFDVVVRHARWLAFVGDWAYNTALRLNVVINAVRRRLGKPYWSLSGWAKRNVKNAVSFIGRVEQALSHEARQGGFDGVICGHIHCAAIRQINGVDYINSGDWVESCTAVVEEFDGRLVMVKRTDRPSPRPPGRRRRWRDRVAAVLPIS